MARRLLTSLIALLLVLPVAVLSNADSAAAAGDGLAFSSTTTYTIDAASGVVHVLAEMTLTNTLPDQRDGNYINRRYFSGFSLPAPVGALNPVATSSNGRALGLTGRFIDGNTDFFLYDIDLASNLFYQQTARVNVTYDITGLPPRSENPSRVNAAYAAFDAFGIGDDGKVTVRVVVPRGFVIDVFGDDAMITYENGNTVYTATDIENPNEFDIFVSARNDEGLLDTSVRTDAGDEFNLRVWPGDTEWQDFVTTQIEGGVPVLSDLIGQPWPIDDEVEVREAYTPYLYGYAGWFSARDNEIEIGEDLDQEVVLHELSHAWFNDGWFVDRWLSEGFAQVYSNKTVTALGGTALEPKPISSSDPGKVTLNDWNDPDFSEGADEVEQFGYNAAFAVVQEIVDEIGDDKMREVLQAVEDRSIAYLGDAERESLGFATNWRRFLDFAEEIGGSKVAAELIEEHVATTTEQELLEDRTAARTVYQELVEAGGEWAAPFVVREEMASWDFDSVGDTIDDATGVLALRDELDARSAELGVDYPGTFEEAYEATETDFVDVTADIEEQIATAEQVLAAVTTDAEDDSLIEKVGLMGTDLPGLLDEAKAALAAGDHELARAKAQEVVDTIEKAPDVGKERSLLVGGGVLLFLLLVILLIVLRRRRRKRRRAAAAALAAAEAEVGTFVEGDVVEVLPAQQVERVDATTEDSFGVAAEPVEAAGEEGQRVHAGPDVAVEEIAQVDLARHSTFDPPTHR